MKINSRKKPFKALHKLSRRFQSLLEVLIAFVLIALCVLPLIYPHIAIYKQQLEFSRKLELDHLVNLLYGRVLEKLYMNTIPWHDIPQTTFEVDDALLKEVQYDKPMVYAGTFTFGEGEPRFKPKDPSEYTLYLYPLTFNFIPKELKNTPGKVKESDIIKYRYDVFLVRDLRK